VHGMFHGHKESFDTVGDCPIRGAPQHCAVDCPSPQIHSLAHRNTAVEQPLPQGPETPPRLLDSVFDRVCD
jgi:hypothetical protein